MFWSSASEARQWLEGALAHVTIAVGNQDEVEWRSASAIRIAAAAALLELGVELAVVKRGADGVLAATRSEVVELAPVRLPVVNGLGR